MSEKETQEGLEKARQEAAEQARKEAEEAYKKEKEGTIADLQAERQKRQAAEEELERAKSNSTPESDPEKAVERILKEKEEREAKEAKEKALEEFKQSVRELNPENDEAGIVYKKFESELSKFNLSNLKTKDDFKQRFKDVYDYMNRKNSQATPSSVPYEGTNPGSGSQAKEVDGDALTDAEQRLIKDMGWEKDRYLKQKAVRPHYVASLLKYRS